MSELEIATRRIANGLRARPPLSSGALDHGFLDARGAVDIGAVGRNRRRSREPPLQPCRAERLEPRGDKTVMLNQPPRCSGRLSARAESGARHRDGSSGTSCDR